MKKTPESSSAITTELVLPSDANFLGTVFGGKVMSWIDITAAIAASRHSRRTVVTASLDTLHFRAPVKVGQIVYLKARVNFAARTSMEVGVRVESEDPLTGRITHTATAYTTFVALDENGKPTPVPAISPKTAEDKRRHREAQHRREARVQLAEKLEKELSGPRRKRRPKKSPV